MSLIRPEWLDDFIKPAPSASLRLRGLKSFEPHHVPAFQDALYADDPTFWTMTSDLGAVATFFGHSGIQTPSDDSMVCIVDLILVSTGSVSDAFSVDVVLGGSIGLLLNTTDAVFKRNRRELSRTTGPEKCGLLKIDDNANAFTGTPIATVRGAQNTTVAIPLGFRLYANEQLFVRNKTVNQTLTATIEGRLTTKGQR